MPEMYELRQMQALPLSAKIVKTQQRIREWYNHFDGDVYVSFSGGKYSTVLAHLVKGLYPDVPLIFVNTGLEYPEIQQFARKMGAEFITPKMRFNEVVSKYGYPLIGKEVARQIYYARQILNGSATPITQKSTLRVRMCLQGAREKKNGEPSIFNRTKYLPLCTETQFAITDMCCDYMKKKPNKEYQKKTGRVPIIGTLAEESLLRQQAWLKHGCNSFEGKKTSQPMSFWTEQDVLRYIKENGVEISSVYGEISAVDSSGYEYEPLCGVDCKLKCSGCQRTGCVFCAFGAQSEKGETRFQRLAKTHPKQYEYCMNGGQWVDNPKYDPTAPAYDGDWKNWNPKKIWVPSKKGLGMRKVFDDCNAIYGKDFIRYE